MTQQKADFSDIYTSSDPRAYHQTLSALDYRIPEHGCQVFEPVIEKLREGGEQDPTVLDVCCSYGINATLLNHDVTLSEVQDHYAGGSGLSRDELVERDREFFAPRRRAEAVDVIGLDTSEPALDYATDAGLLSGSILADLENNEMSDDSASRLNDVDLVTVTGGIGYIGARTFDRILGATEESPWVAALSLRWVDFDPIAEALARHGLVTERLDDLVVSQRRFNGEEEEAFVFEELTSRGLEPTELERSGHHAAEVYLSRSPAAAAESPVEDVLAALV